MIKKRRLQCYEINLLYIIDSYRQMGIATKTILDLEQKYKVKYMLGAKETALKMQWRYFRNLAMFTLA